MSLKIGTVILNGKYLVVEKLDEGRYGHVYKVENTQTKETFALKSISKMDIKKNSTLRHNISREIFIHKQLDHPNIVKFIESSEDSKRKYIVLEYVDLGDLFDLLYSIPENLDSDSESESNQFFSEDEAMDYFYQLVSAMMYLRDINILHRDLKPENILINSIGELKLADFGWATNKPSNDNVGTTKYSSPEMIFDDKNYDYKTDVWSLGVILYEFLYGASPYEAKKERKVEEKIEKVFFKFPDKPVTSDKVKDLIRKILSKHPTQRPDYEEILEHEWLKPMIERNNDTNSELEIEFNSQYNSDVEISESNSVSEENNEQEKEESSNAGLSDTENIIV